MVLPVWVNYGMQEGVSEYMEEVIMFHDGVMGVFMFILMVLSGMLLSNLLGFNVGRFSKTSHSLECVWGLIPGLVLMSIVFFSLSELYGGEEFSDSLFTVKVMGSQWFWTYYWGGEKVDVILESSMITDDDLLWCLDVESRMVLPYGWEFRFLVTSSDVIHSFSVPSLGVKMDALPGRVNQLSLDILRAGVFFGQCSEICGMNHSFMPIVIEGVGLMDFISFSLISV